MLGRVVGAHGVAGLVRVRWFGDDGSHLLAAEDVVLARSAEDPETATVAVESASHGKPGELRMRLAGVETREQAEALRGRLVLGEAAALPPLETGEHYWYELIGCRVETVDGRDIGRVIEIWDPGAHDVLVVEDEKGRRQLVPAAEPFLREVDVAGRRIRIETIPGLLED